MRSSDRAASLLRVLARIRVALRRAGAALGLSLVGSLSSLVIPLSDCDSVSRLADVTHTATWHAIYRHSTFIIFSKNSKVVAVAPVSIL